MQSCEEDFLTSPKKARTVEALSGCVASDCDSGEGEVSDIRKGKLSR